MEHPLFFSALYILAFFSFLKISNMVPHSASTFDVYRHLFHGDVMLSYDMAIILVKWYKTNQLRNKVVKLSIPVLPGSLLCPVTALKRLVNTFGWQKVIFHSFRRSGASWAFQYGVPIEAIKQQGTWASDCVWHYINTQTSSDSPCSMPFTYTYVLDGCLIVHFSGLWMSHWYLELFHCQSLFCGHC